MLDYSAGVASQEGDSYQILSSGDGLSGMFSNTTAVADGRIWDITVSNHAVFVTAAALAPTIDGRFRWR